MSNILKLVLLAILLILMAPESAGICKWVDKDGVVHYAETCPEDTRSTEVQIEPPPTQQQIEATRERADRVRSEIQARSAQKEQEKEQKSGEKQPSDKSTDTMNKNCAEAKWNLEILRKQLPVYYDQENRLHYNRSLHSYWYEGQRTYLDDPERAAKILHYAQLEQQTCTESEADIRARIKMYMENRDREICQHLKSKLENMKKFSTGIPSDEMRELEETIATKCR